MRLLYTLPIAILCAIQGFAEEAVIDLPSTEAVEQAIDAFVEPEMDRIGIPGGVVAVVWQGEVLLTKGYGIADRERDMPADPSHSMFRMASVTKLFTWVAVMQMVEEEKLDLDADINTYMSTVQIPDRNGEPITMRQLMTHTPGFADRLIGLWSASEDELAPLETIMLDLMPERIYAPGEVASYSNYGTALAGHIVAELSGQTWHAYVQENIFNQLGMVFTTVDQPTPERFAEHLAKGYSGTPDNLSLGSNEYLRLQAAGAAQTTADDMATFMVELMTGDTLLRRETVETMLTPQHGYHEDFSHIAHGFFQMPIGPFKGIGHTGDSTYFHSSFMMIPEQEFGVFAVFNHEQCTPVSRGVAPQLVETFLVGGVDVGEPKAMAVDVSEFAGIYGSTRHGANDITRLNMIVDHLVLASDGEGRLIAKGRGFDPEGTLIMATGDHIFQDASRSKGIAFLRDDGGTVRYAALGHAPLVDYKKLPAYATPNGTLVIAGGSALLATLVLVGMVLSSLVRRVLRSRAEDDSGIDLLARLANASIALSIVGAFVCLALAMRDPLQILFGMYPMMYAAQILSWASVTILPALLVITAVAWRSSTAGVLGRVRMLAASIAGIGGVWWFYYWGLLGL